MVGGKVNNFLIPNVSKVSKRGNVNAPKTLDEKIKSSEFKNILDQKLEGPKKPDLKLSTHALRRLEERSLEMDNKELGKLNDAMEKLRNKGGKDSLVITNKAAYILDVDKGTVVTAIDKSRMAENVFTKIDSTLFVD